MVARPLIGAKSVGRVAAAWIAGDAKVRGGRVLAVLDRRDQRNEISLVVDLNMGSLSGPKLRRAVGVHNLQGAHNLHHEFTSAALRTVIMRTGMGPTHRRVVCWW